MPLSASTLIHFTNTKEKLMKILEEDFRIYNCKEEIVLDVKKGGYVAPMVSFCDIPLSEVKSHISKYGTYGLGMTKAWGTKRGLNPVLYIAKGSTLAKSYRTAFTHFADTGDREDWSNEQKAVADVLRYIKNYEADLTRGGKTIRNYRFSDEREWRYVPSYTESCDMILPLGFYADHNNKRASDEKLTDLRLTFAPNDIKYIIINDDSEIRDFIDHLRRAKGKKFTLDDIERLTTRLLTSEQIQSDM